MSKSEQRVLGTFREYLITPGKMLCFYGPNLAKHKSALRQLTEKGMLIKEQFHGGYTLTHDGFVAMKSCE